jgi:hypothetical protein
MSMGELAHFSYMWWSNPRRQPERGGDARESHRHHAIAGRALRVLDERDAAVADHALQPRGGDCPVDRALASGERVAVVGYVGFTGGLENLVSNRQAITNIDRKYFVYVGTDRPLLDKARFRFAN